MKNSNKRIGSFPISVAFIQTVAPDYRKKVFDFINQDKRIDFTLYAGDTYFEPSVTTKIVQKYLKKIKNTYLLKRRFLFQTGMWKEALKSDVTILELNPRIISNWLILLFRKLKLKQTIVWGHAWPRNGKDSSSDFIRNIMRILADKIIVYTKKQHDELKLKNSNKKIHYAPNSLYYKKEMNTEKEIVAENITNIIYVGRLTQKKKPLILVSAFHNIIDQLPENVKLLIVGRGAEFENINQYIKLHQLENRINLLNHISDYHKLKDLYKSSLVSVSPGYGGLSITQSFGFGVPMIISRNEKHAPEIEASIEDFNTLFFDNNSKDELGYKILEIFNNKQKWVLKRGGISENCKANYSIENMGNSIVKTILDER